MTFYLNGWQRIWVVVSLVFGVGLIVVTNQSLPQPLPGSNHQRLQDAIERATSREEAFQLSGQQLAEARYNLNVRHIRERRIRNSVILWVAFTVALYWSGLVARWVRRGFRSEA